jgi:hypothetical protein
VFNFHLYQVTFAWGKSSVPQARTFIRPAVSSQITRAVSQDARVGRLFIHWVQGPSHNELAIARTVSCQILNSPEANLAPTTPRTPSARSTTTVKRRTEFQLGRAKPPSFNG